MIKYFSIIFLTLCLTTHLFSQEISITTEFVENGNLLEGISIDSKIISSFKKKEKCYVIAYSGRGIYQVKYNDLVGFVNDEFLLVSEDMMDLYFDYQEKERLKTIKEEAERKKKIKTIQENAAEEKQKIIDKINNDSILKVKEEKIADSVRLEKITSRNTCNYQMNEFDNLYNTRIIRTEAYAVSKDLTIELYRLGKSVQVFFNFSEDLGCVSYLPSNRSSVKIKLENNKIISVYHSWDIDCGIFSFKGKLSSSQTASLEKSAIKSISLKGTKLTRELTDIDYKEFFIDKLKCIE